jgi:N,N-dimethylformamidase
LFGYTDRLSAAPGETLDVLASSTSPLLTLDVVRLICGDEDPAGPGAKIEAVEVEGAGEYGAGVQAVACGSLAVAPLPGDEAWPSFTVALWLWPTTPAHGRRQGLVARDGHFALCIGPDGALELEIAGAVGARIAPGPRERRWSHVVASFDAQSGRAALSLDSAAWPPQHDAEVADVAAPAAGTDAPIILAATALDPAFSHPAGVEHYNGKLEEPRLWNRALAPDAIDGASDALVAAWDLGRSAESPVAGVSVADTARDCSGNGHDASLWNLPSRPATGYAWTGMHERADLAPDQYGACHFHEDDLDDCRWSPTATLRLPDDLPSGVYGARLRAGELEDVIPFFVRPPRGASSADVAVLFPTVSYGAYANERMQDREFVHEPGVLGREILPDQGDLVLRAHPELGGSLYDSHSDGSGVCFSSFRRPVLNMRPGHRNWQTHAPRALSADLYLVDWLRGEQIPFDAIIDHDLHDEGAALLEPYRVVITGCHPEYWTNAMLDALVTWLDAGGRLMYLGGNGFYWVTSIDPARPHIVEVRRGVCGVRTWESQPGEFHHTSTGELGGLWRNRGRSPNALVGVGFAAQGFDDAAPGYHQLPGARDTRAAFVFEGIAHDEVIGDFGLSMGGAAADEIDRHDIRYGSPPEALVLATSQGGHSDYILLVPEDIPVTHLRVGGTTCDDVRADITLMPTGNGGAVFSTSSIGWTAAMAVNGYDNNAARMSANVLRRFLEPEPLDLAPAHEAEVAL